MVKKYKVDKKLNASAVAVKVNAILTHMKAIFISRDPLLTAQSIISIYYLFFRDMHLENKTSIIDRSKFVAFVDAVSANREVASDDVTLANYDLLEYDRMTQQGTNDAISI